MPRFKQTGYSFRGHNEDTVFSNEFKNLTVEEAKRLVGLYPELEAEIEFSEEEQLEYEIALEESQKSVSNLPFVPVGPIVTPVAPVEPTAPVEEAEPVEVVESVEEVKAEVVAPVEPTAPVA